MNLIEFSSPGRDNYGRKYPVKIKFKDGKVVFGHIKDFSFDGNNTTNIHFRIIKNIDNWCKNINEENQEILKFNDEIIEDIKVYKCV